MGCTGLAACPTIFGLSGFHSYRKWSFSKKRILFFVYPLVKSALVKLSLESLRLLKGWYRLQIKHSKKKQNKTKQNKTKQTKNKIPKKIYNKNRWSLTTAFVMFYSQSRQRFVIGDWCCQVAASSDALGQFLSRVIRWIKWIDDPATSSAVALSSWQTPSDRGRTRQLTIWCTSAAARTCGLFQEVPLCSWTGSRRRRKPSRLKRQTPEMLWKKLNRTLFP